MSMTSEIEQLITLFIAGNDTSIEAANRIELALDDYFPEDDYVQATVEMLAMFRPEGGAFLFDRDAINQRLGDTLQYLRKTP